MYSVIPKMSCLKEGGHCDEPKCITVNKGNNFYVNNIFFIYSLSNVVYETHHEIQFTHT